MDIFLPCLYSCLGCIGFCLLFNIRGKMIPLATIGGTLGWFVFMLFNNMHNTIIQSFLAMLAVAAYSEIMARIYKMPVTVFLIVGLIPLVPGSNIYYTMEHCISGNIMEFMKTGLDTLAISGALALGILLVSSITRLIISIMNYMKRQKRHITSK